MSFTLLLNPFSFNCFSVTAFFIFSSFFSANAAKKPFSSAVISRLLIQSIILCIICSTFTPVQSAASITIFTSSLPSLSRCSSETTVGNPPNLPTNVSKNSAALFCIFARASVSFVSKSLSILASSA